MSTNDGTQKQNTVEVENHHCSKCGWERLLWRPQDKCAHVLICPLCLMTRPHSSQECDKYTGIRIEKLEVQVEVYRKALEELWAWKESDTVKGWFQMAHIHGSRVSEEYFKKVEDMNSRIKALLTSKPEPVAKTCPKCEGTGRIHVGAERFSGYSNYKDCDCQVPPSPSVEDDYMGPGCADEITDEKPSVVGPDTEIRKKWCVHHFRGEECAIPEGHPIHQDKKFLDFHKFKAPVAPVRKWEEEEEK